MRFMSGNFAIIAIAVEHLVGARQPGLVALLLGLDLAQPELGLPRLGVGVGALIDACVNNASNVLRPY